MKIKWVSKSILLVILLTCIPFNNITNVLAQDINPTDDEVNAISKQLYCPVCESIPLDACGTQACIQWRDTIRAKLSDGWAEEEIKQYFSDQYGIRVLAEPPVDGFNTLLWYLPPSLFLIGALLVTRLLSNTKNKLHVQHETISNIDNANHYVERIEHDLKKWQ